MKEIKDHMGRGVQLAVEEGMFVITHADGVLKLYNSEADSLMGTLDDEMTNVVYRPADGQKAAEGKKKS